MVYEIWHRKYERRDVTHEIWQIWDITYEKCCVIYEIRDMRYETGNMRCEVLNMKHAIWYETWAVKSHIRDIRCELWDAGHGFRMRTCRGKWTCTYWNLSYWDSTWLLFTICDQRILHMEIRKFGSYNVGVQCGILQKRIIRCGILQCGCYIVRYYKSQTAGLWNINPNPHLPVLHIWGSYDLGSINVWCFNVGSCDVGFYKIWATDLESVRSSSVLRILGSCNAESDNVGY